MKTMMTQLIPMKRACGLAAALLATSACMAQNSVVRPKVDGEGVGFSVTGDRVYPVPGPDPDITVKVTDLLEDGFYFEHQVQGQSDGSNPTFPTRWLYPNSNPGPHSLAFSVPKSNVHRVRSELFFEGSRPSGFSMGPNPWTDPTHSNWLPWNTARTTGFNVFLPKPSGSSDTQRAANAGNGIFMQWWQYSPANPPMALTFTISGGFPRVVLNVDNEAGETGGDLWRIHYPLTYNDLGNWFDVCVAYTLSQTSTGSVQMWLKKHGETAWRDARLTSTNAVLEGNNGVKTSNIRIGFAENDNGISHKVGIYRPWTGSNPWTIRFDNLYNGNNTAEVNAAWTSW
jgi:hypothetical protein